MSKRKEKGRIGGPFVPVLKEMLTCPAWLAMEPSSRLLYIALKGRYGIEIKNNGRIYLSVRTAMKEIGLSFNTIRRGFQELQHYGFIVMTAAGCLGVDGWGKAPHWRLPELGYMNNAPTKDYLRWDGALFVAAKKQNPDAMSESPRLNHCVIRVTQPVSQLEAEVTQPLRHTDDPDRLNHCVISRLTTGSADEAPLTGLLTWSPPVIEEVFGEEAARLRAYCEEIIPQRQPA